MWCARHHLARIEPPRDDDAGHPLGGERDVLQAHAGVDGEVVDPLLALLAQGLHVDPDGELLDLALHLLERLVDRHRADRHGRVADDRLAGGVDVLAGREVHHRVGAPLHRPGQLLDLLLDSRGDRRVADVGVDLGLEGLADHHRLELGVADVGRDDGAPAGDLRTDRLGVDALAVGDEAHLLGDDPLAGVEELRRGGIPGAARDPGGARQGDAETVRGWLVHVAFPPPV